MLLLVWPILATWFGFAQWIPAYLPFCFWLLLFDTSFDWKSVVECQRIFLIHLKAASISVDIVDGCQEVNHFLWNAIKTVDVLHRELLLNNNQLRVLPFELGKLFQLQTLGLKGEWLISVFCSHSSLEIPWFVSRSFNLCCSFFTRKPTCTRNYEPLPGTWWHAKTAQLLVRQSGRGDQTQ